MITCQKCGSEEVTIEQISFTEDVIVCCKCGASIGELTQEAYCEIQDYWAWREEKKREEELEKWFLEELAELAKMPLECRVARIEEKLLRAEVERE